MCGCGGIGRFQLLVPRSSAHDCPWCAGGGWPGGRAWRRPPDGPVRPVIVTVDDDPGVSRAVARDLRRRYGERHRIVRAESGGRGPRRAAADEAARRAGGRAPGRLPDAGDERHRVPRTGHGHLSGGPAGAADRLRRHRCRHRRDQRGGPGLLPAQAVGPARGEALPGRGLAAGAPGWPRITGRFRRTQGGRTSLVGAFLGGPRVPGPQPGVLPLVPRGRTGGEAAPRRGGGGRDDAARGDHARTARRWSSRPTPSLPAASGWRRRRRPTSTTWSSSAAGRGLGAAVYGASEGLRTVLVERPRPAVRRARARGSRTTSVSPTGSPERSSPTVPGGRPPSSARNC